MKSPDMLKNTDQFYDRQVEPIKGCLLALRGIVLGLDHTVWETVKYGMPCFCKGKKAFCYLWTDKKTGNPYLLFVEGHLMHHPLLEKGNRSRMKILNVDPTEDIPLPLITTLLQEALSLVDR